MWWWISLNLFSIVLGILITLIIQFYFLHKYFSRYKDEAHHSRLSCAPFQLPQVLLQTLRSNSSSSQINSPEGCMALNILFQFLFHELRDTARVRSWFKNKLTLEFEELLTRTAIGKIFGSIKVRDISLGSEFPLINSIVIDDVKINDDFSHIDAIDIKLDVSYKGGFQLTVDANMLLGKAAYMSIKVGALHGLGRLQFTRLPYSHWSFSFYDEPKLELEVESQFQGRPLPQITTLISNQIRKSVRKKHTLPNYKLRYKPFFSASEELSSAEDVPSSTLSLSLHHLSRLHQSTPNEVFCLVGVDSLPWIDIFNVNGFSFYLLDVIITKRPSNPLGITFKQEYLSDRSKNCVLVDTSTQNEVLIGDIIVSVDGKKVTQATQLPKMLKNSAVQVTLRIERRAPDLIPESCKWKSLYESDSSGSASISGTPSKQRNDNIDLKKSTQLHLTQQGTTVDTNSANCSRLVQTRTLRNNQIVEIDETVNLSVVSGDKYLNISIKGVEQDKQDVLAAYTNIPLSSLYNAADNVHSLRLKPPDSFAASVSRSFLSGQNGFIPLLCFGDVLLSAELKKIPGTSSPVKGEQPSSPDTSRPNSGERKHVFVRTHLHSSAHCDFCGKKIWLKDAEKCSDCGMTCHKKCVVKCKTTTICSGVSTGLGLVVDSSAAAALTPALDLASEDHGTFSDKVRRTSTHPEIVMTPCVDQVVTKALPTAQSGARKGLSSLLASVASAGRGLKRVGSAHNLQLPGEDAQGENGSKSLPPSPQQTPVCSRKPSLPLELGEDISSLLQTLMQQGTDQGDMMCFAKATGKTLFEDLDLPERKEKIQEMMNSLKVAINNETEIRLSLTREELSSKDATNKTKAAFLIGKSDEKTQALTVLMLHFCSGLQHIQDLEEQEREAMNQLIDSEGQPIEN